ncbi:hypothetical protein LTR17_012287 [Elasticomyces elasticus]|nr:hypothetical protein LTR17_012287 [Elasticomyces elasticus]
MRATGSIFACLPLLWSQYGSVRALHDVASEQPSQRARTRFAHDARGTGMDDLSWYTDNNITGGMRSPELLGNTDNSTGATHPRNSSQPAEEWAPLIHPKADLVQDEYIVRLRPNHTLEHHFARIQADLANSCDPFNWMELLNAYHTKIDSQEMLDQIRQDPGVEYVEHNTRMLANLTMPMTNPTFSNLTDPLPNLGKRWTELVESTKRLYSNAIMSSPKKLATPVLDGQHQAFSIDRAGHDVNIYIMDTGIRLTHEAFRGRAVNFQQATTSKYCNGETMDDTAGHGTFVAGIAVGHPFGMASAATAVNVKMVCAGETAPSVANIVMALDDIAIQHISNKQNPPPGWRGSVINMSWGNGEDSASMELSVNIATQNGIALVTAAGNSNQATTDVSPCNFKNAVCVGASDENYGKWTDATQGSNYGPEIDIWAPGKLVTSSTKDSDFSTSMGSGTSFACPAVAGILAGFVSWEGLSESQPTALQRLIQDNGQKYLLDATIQNSVNLLANNGIKLGPANDQQIPYKGAPESEAPAPQAPAPAKQRRNVVAREGVTTTTDVNTVSYTLGNPSTTIESFPEGTEVGSATVTFSDADTTTTIIIGPTSSTEGTKTSTSHSTTPKPVAPSCTYQDGTPEVSSACLCSTGSTTITVTPLTVPKATLMDQSCAFTTWPGTVSTITAPPKTVSTDFPGCQVCTLDGEQQAQCSLLASSLGCTRQSTATTITFATTGVTVGTFTGAALSTAVAKAIDSACHVTAAPSDGASLLAWEGNFTCDETVVASVADDIIYVNNDGDWASNGKLTLSFKVGAYDSYLTYVTFKDIIAAGVSNSTQGNCPDASGSGSVPGPVDGHISSNDGPLSLSVCKASNFWSVSTSQSAPASGGDVSPVDEFAVELALAEVEVPESFDCLFAVGLLALVELAADIITDAEATLPAEITLDEDLLEACKGATGSD